jgi:hydrogenase 3 maturation protease
MIPEDVRSLLAAMAGKKTVLITIGNELRSDDGVGPYIFNALPDDVGSLVCINAATRPDLVIEPAVEENPDMVLLIDAAAFDGDPGEIALIPTEAISNYTLSTHTFPMGAIASIISEDADCPVHFIGIQPVTNGDG